ncbi:hypothetical protein WA026_002951 [Henosepilachna vigintioctopunctata]|uniref:Uncharacterized protein n=1 Tax=Henosepilachna vigintioctopunctata TaxID=420089 RepID=A0AAW1TGZ0_9CUCU
MKSVFVVAAAILVISLASVKAIEDEKDCKCWKDFVPELHIDHYHCRGLKHKRLFDCNEPEIALCKCTVDGKQITLDLGELHCAGLKTGQKECDNHEDFAEFFEKNPQLKLHH